MDDIAQIALIRIFKKLHTVRNRDSFFSWVDKIAVNTVREHFRRGVLDRFMPFAKDPDALPSSSVADPARRTENRRLIDRVVAHLGGIRPKKRTALVLSMAHGYSVSEIAQLTGCSQETAKKRLQHGRRELLTKARKDKYLCRVFQEIDR
jgi:RNA polymerase sigma-70 factor (ECF subfamily)